jgi:hypothetical protein
MRKWAKNPTSDVFLSNNANDLVGKLKFAKPTKVAVAGSFMLKTVAKPNMNVDLAFEIPSVTMVNIYTSTGLY